MNSQESIAKVPRQPTRGQADPGEQGGRDRARGRDEFFDDQLEGTGRGRRDLSRN